MRSSLTAARPARCPAQALAIRMGAAQDMRAGTLQSKFFLVLGHYQVLAVLTSDGAFVSLPDAVISSGLLSGLLSDSPQEGERNGTACPPDSPLQPVGEAELLFDASQLDVAACAQAGRA